MEQPQYMICWAQSFATNSDHFKNNQEESPTSNKKGNLEVHSYSKTMLRSLSERRTEWNHQQILKPTINGENNNTRALHSLDRKDALAKMY